MLDPVVETAYGVFAVAHLKRAQRIHVLSNRFLYRTLPALNGMNGARKKMKVHASKEELESMPDWASDFLSAAWAPPNEEGQRAPVDYFERMREIGDRFADRLRDAIQSPGMCRHNISLVVSEKPAFVEWNLIGDRQVQIAHRLMLAWNSRATLAHCEACGSLMQPAKGRVARTCCDACRLKLHRQVLSELGGSVTGPVYERVKLPEG